jgi:hypothetical protein
VCERFADSRFDGRRMLVVERQAFLDGGGRVDGDDQQESSRHCSLQHSRRLRAVLLWGMLAYGGPSLHTVERPAAVQPTFVVPT